MYSLKDIFKTQTMCHGSAMSWENSDKQDQRSPRAHGADCQGEPDNKEGTTRKIVAITVKKMNQLLFM